jgi:hypothetical protein
LFRKRKDNFGTNGNMKSHSLAALLLFLALGRSLAPAAVAPAPAGTPDFGPNVFIFDAATPAADIQAALAPVSARMEANQFGSERYAVLFKPGTYDVPIKLGFYMQVCGLGGNPDDTVIAGRISASAQWMGRNATCNFWRAVENLYASHSRGMLFAVSQGTEMRRVHIAHSLTLAEDGWSSGGFFADCKIDGPVGSYSQQQWFARGSRFNRWSNGVWNQVFVGCQGAPAENFPAQAYTVIDRTPIIREKPYLIFEGGRYAVMVPDLRKETAGPSWESAASPGQPVSIDQFHIARADRDTAATLNAALRAGRHLLFTPGLYPLSETLLVTRPDTIVLGLGYPTLMPEGGAPAIDIADVDGVKVGGLLLDATRRNTRTMVQVGRAGSTVSHANNPICLYDLFIRVGGAIEGRADCMVTLDANQVIAENLWLWRADHGKGAGWNDNRNAHGLVVNGRDVVIYGLFVEHAQGYQTVWNGENGRLYFYQSEMPYDVPGQDDWKHGTVNGFASYKVGDRVTSHEAWGLGVYCYFNQGLPIWADCAIEAPVGPGIKLHHLTSIHLNGSGGIRHVLNDQGTQVQKGTLKATLK